MLDLTSLNERQKEAVLSKKHTLVVASAGTGKTRVLTLHLCHLLEQKVNAKNIYAFTFTNKAAKEMTTRIAKIRGSFIDSTISTFHSYYYSIINTFANYIGFDDPVAIIDEDERLGILKDIIKELKIQILDKNIKKRISDIKNHTPYIVDSLKEQLQILLVFKKYQERLKKCNRMDFDDLQYYMLDLLQKEDFQEIVAEDIEYILVDEAQDVNNIQFEILLLLSKYAKQVFMVGDQDQCIYTFRGSNFENMNYFVRHFKAKTIILEENYRSTEAILKCANEVIKNNVNRIDKKMFTSNSVNAFHIQYRPYKTVEDEARFAATLIKLCREHHYQYEDIAILYRNNASSHAFEKELILNHIPFKVYGSYPFFRYKEIKNILNIYQFIHNPHDDIAFLMMSNYPKKLFSEKFMKEIQSEQARTQKSYYSLLQDKEEAKDFLQLIEELQTQIKEKIPVDFYDFILEKLNYLHEVSKDKKANEKINHLLEFKEYIANIPYELQNIEKSTMEWLNHFYLLDEKEESLNMVKIMTIHQAKGLEFKVVILVDLNEGILPKTSQFLSQKEEERRIFYVGITRAKERLFLTSAERHFINGKMKFLSHSSFLNEITELHK